VRLDDDERVPDPDFAAVPRERSRDEEVAALADFSPFRAES